MLGFYIKVRERRKRQRNWAAF